MTSQVIGSTARAWFSISQALRMKNPSLRRFVPFRRNRKGPTVIAVGGNSFEGLERATAKRIVDLIQSGRTPVVTHGNGLQVGDLLLKYPEKTIAQCVHITQVEMGKQMKKELLREAAKRNISVDVKVIPTRVIVDAKDPAFNNLTKYIGPDYTLPELHRGDLGITRKLLTKLGMYKIIRPNGKEWIIKEVTEEKGKFRRVVASPTPLEIHPDDLAKIQKHVADGKVVIAVGGGGVAVSRTPMEEGFKEGPMEAVIDKDLASALLTKALKARELIISTGVKHAALNWNKKNQQNIRYMQTALAIENVQAGHFLAGSMGEKIEASVYAVSQAGLDWALISHPESDWLGFEGTIITRGLDVGGRFYNLSKKKEIRRWAAAKEASRPASLGSVLIRHSKSRGLKF